MGTKYCAINRQDGKKPPYDRNNRDKHPSAIHLHLDQKHYDAHKGKIAKIFKSGLKVRIQGMQLRIVPDFATIRGLSTCSPAIETALTTLASQQLTFTRQLRIIKVPWIVQLDSPLAPDVSMTLRRHVMALAPRLSPAQRLIHSVSPPWQGQSRDLNYHFSVLEHLIPAAESAIKNLIPECIHLYGAKAAPWFTKVGVKQHSESKWEPNTRTAVFNDDTQLSKLLEEDCWNISSILTALDPTPIKLPTTPSHERSTTKNLTSMGIALERMNTPSARDVPSLGALYDRDKDDDTIATTVDEPTVQDPAEHQAVIGFDSQAIESDRNEAVSDKHSISMSTAANTTGTTRLGLQMTKENLTVNGDAECLGHCSRPRSGTGRSHAVPSQCSNSSACPVATT
jgi:hypothetical protein